MLWVRVNVRLEGIDRVTVGGRVRVVGGGRVNPLW